MGRLEVRRLSAVAPPPEPAQQEDEEAAPRQRSSDQARIPVARLYVVAEAVPLGTLAAALSRELGVGIAVAPSLVDARVSLALPDSTAEELFKLLGLLYDVVARASSSNDSLSILEDKAQWIQQRFFEPPDLIVQLIPVEGLPAEQVATTYCKHFASTHGSATVIGDKLVVKDVRSSLERLQVLLKRLQDKPRTPESAGEVGASRGEATASMNDGSLQPPP
jgi:type II secretory pathway component GspD/PulD (secretin)